MVSTSLAVFALTGAMAATIPSQPSWQPDYATAAAQSSREQKPIAVFIGHGPSGVRKLVADGALPEAAVKLLKAEYVSLYIDADSEAGRTLAQSFGMTEGVVVSDRTGAKQAVRHAGTVTGTNLVNYLEKYADPAVAVTTTETNVQPVVVTPVVVPAQYYAPAPSFAAPVCRT